MGQNLGVLEVGRAFVGSPKAGLDDAQLRLLKEERPRVIPKEKRALPVP